MILIIPYLTLFTISCQLLSFSNAEPLMGQEPRKIKPVKSGEFPYVALIAVKKFKAVYEAHHCTGVLITKRSVLTSARCLEDTPLTNLHVIFGSISPRSPLHKVFEIKTKITYKDWLKETGTEPRKSSTDIAVLKLVSRDTEIKPADLSYDVDLQRPALSVSMIGWGHTYQGDYTPKNPQIARLKIIEKDECIKKDRFAVLDSFFCAAADPTVVGVKGDFGGPVLDQTRKFVIGILVEKYPKPEPYAVDAGQINLVLKLSDFKDFVDYIRSKY